MPRRKKEVLVEQNQEVDNPPAVDKDEDEEVVNKKAKTAGPGIRLRIEHW